MAKKKPAEQPDDPVTESPVDVDDSGLEAALESETVDLAPETEVVESPESTEQDSGGSLREYLKANGINVAGETDDDAVAAIQDRMTRFEQIEHDREALRQQVAQSQAILQSLQPQFAEWQQWKQQQAAPKQAEAPSPEAFFDKLLEAPKLPTDWQSWLDPETKQLRAETPPQIRQAVAEYIDYRDNLPTRLASELKANLPEFIRAEARKIASEQVGGQFQQIEKVQTAKALIAQNADWLYAQDTNGRSLYNPLTGNGPLTPLGQRMSELLNHFHNVGVTNPSDAWSLAHERLYLEAQAAKATAQTQATGGAESRTAFLKEQAAARKPNRSGSIAPGNRAPAQNPNQPYRDMIAAALQEVGVGD